MIKLTKSLQALAGPNFKTILKTDIQNIDPALLPLQQGLSLSSYVSDNPFSVTILNVTETPDALIIKSGVFYTGIIAGCSCADDPSPQDQQNEYCEVQFTIDKSSAETNIILLSD